jgi:DNA repair protein RecO (recombination protein O)
MAMYIKDQGICIHTVDYSETSQVVTFFTRDHGKVGAMAKGSRRPKSAIGGRIELFSYGDLVLVDSPNAKLATLTEFQARFDVVVGMSSRLSAYHCALLATELLDKLTQDRDPHPGLYEGYLEFLQEDIATQEVLPGLIRFQWGLLRQIGLEPVTDRCANCQTPLIPAWPECYFSSLANGLICRDCEGAFADRISVSGPAARVLTGIDRQGASDPAACDTVERLLINHFSNLLHHRPRTADYVLRGLSPGPG